MNPILIFLLAVCLAVYLIKTKMRKWRRLSLDFTIRRLMDDLDDIHVIRRLGAGNIGVVYLVELSGKWEKQLGIQWTGNGPPDRQVALKICSFRVREGKRLPVLIELARVINRAIQEGESVRICPFHAIGLITGKRPDKKYIIEIMPVIRGESLEKHILKKGGSMPDFGVLISELSAVLESAVFFEKHGFFTRNLDLDNIIVREDGNWCRIDFDNAEKSDKHPAKRIRRMCRFSVQVLRSVSRNRPDVLVAIRGMEDTLHALQRPGGGDQSEPAIQSTKDLIRVVKGLKA
jgi:serine/threonine protein kinase